MPGLPARQYDPCNTCCMQRRVFSQKTTTHAIAPVACLSSIDHSVQGSIIPYDRLPDSGIGYVCRIALSSTSIPAAAPTLQLSTEPFASASACRCAANRLQCAPCGEPVPCADGAGCKVGGAGHVPSHPDSSHFSPAALGARPNFRPQGTPLSYLHRPKAPEGPSAPAPRHGATHVELSPTALRHWPCLSSRTLQIPSAPPLLHGAGCCSLPLGRF